MTQKYVSLEERFRKKEKAQEDSIDEVMNFIKEKIFKHQQKTDGSLNIM